MEIKDELALFYENNGFGEIIGERPLTVRVYTGCMLVPLPNIETRYLYLKYHDLHHLVTGYSVGRIGEGEVSAWELGTGSFFVNPILGMMNFIALSTGLMLQPKRMWTAFQKGCKSNNLYSKRRRNQVDSGRWKNVAAVKSDILETVSPKAPVLLRIPEFAMYSIIAVFVHALIAIPAVVARLITDMTLGYSFFQAVKPVKRTDLY